MSELSMGWKIFAVTAKLAIVIGFPLLIVSPLLSSSCSLQTKQDCQGAQKRADDTFKVMDVCQQMIGCTITVDDLRKAQEQLNQAEACK